MSLTLEPPASAPPAAPTPSAPKPTPRLTWAEYVEQEIKSPVKHHYYLGELIEVAGATLEHNTLCGNLIGELGAALRGTDCCVLPSNMKVKVSGSVAYYPDVVVCCGQPSITWGDALQNPVLIAEVLSDSTAALDRGPKFQQYHTLASLRHLLFIEQYRPFVEHWEQDDTGTWKFAGQYDALDQTLTFTLGGRQVSIALSDLYRFVVFAPDAEPADDSTSEA